LKIDTNVVKKIRKAIFVGVLFYGVSSRPILFYVANEVGKA